MRKIYIIFMLFLGILTSKAQSNNFQVTNLQVPDAPGFIAQDVSPSIVQHPTSVKAFGLSFFNYVVQNNALPKNFALEFSPFWFIKSPNMSVYKFLGLNQKDTTINAFAGLKLTSLSLAVTNNTDTAKYSLGARATILKIYNKKYRTDLVTAINNLNKLMREINLSSDTLTADEVSKNPKIIAARNNLKSVLQMADMPVFSIDGATALYYFANPTGGPQFGRYAAWLTFNLAKDISSPNQSGNFLNFTMLTRYISDGQSKDSKNNYFTKNYFDAGGKIELAIKQLSFGYEYVFRIAEGQNTYRSVGMVKYKIKEGLYISGAFGRNFVNPNAPNYLVSFLGVNWGLSNNETLTFPK